MLIYYIYYTLAFNEFFFCNFCTCSCGLCFSSWRSPFNISHKDGLMHSSFSFCFSVTLLISPSNLSKSCQIKHSWLWFYPFQHFIMLLSLACSIFAEKSCDHLMDVPLYIANWFLLAGLEQNSWEDFKMSLASTNVLVLEWAPPKSFCQYLYPLLLLLFSC